MIRVGKLNATVTEQSAILNSDLNPSIIITSDIDCQISINDNLNYQDYKADEVIVLQDRKGTINKLFYKVATGTSVIRYWLM